MRYLITSNGHAPFFTNHYDYFNHYDPDAEMVVYDLGLGKYAKDGETWEDIEEDHL